MYNKVIIKTNHDFDKQMTRIKIESYEHFKTDEDVYQYLLDMGMMGWLFREKYNSLGFEGIEELHKKFKVEVLHDKRASF